VIAPFSSHKERVIQRSPSHIYEGGLRSRIPTDFLKAELCIPSDPLLRCFYHFIIIVIITTTTTTTTHAVAQLVQALHYKPNGRGFDSPLGKWNFSLT